ncbi:MAG: N-acetylglucosamine-6-phosphate deacetylase [Blastocatellia bacterium]|jgi:N-acetylglucosamine-6-phosphate deacetylase|nr:N-acetylglucosamine-6-phosphate deacetylase [Blastocatellia bacterium]
MENSRTIHQKLLLRNARLVLPHKLAEGASLLIEGDRIARILKQSTNEDTHDSEVLELDGALLFPGFIDAHIHGAVGVDTMEAGAADLHRVALFLAAHGVTSWLPTLVPAPDVDYRKAAQSVRQLMREQATSATAATSSRALGLHYEGPFINSAQCGALRPAYFRAFAATEELDALATIDESGAIHMMTLAPEIEGGVELVTELRRRGWVVSIGHTRADVAVLDRACAAGARHMTHFMNAMSPLHHRAPGPIGWGLLRDDVTCDVIADGVHIDPLMLRLLLRCKQPSRLALISDAVAPAGLGDGDYEIWGETIAVTGGRTRNARGHIAGSVITMRDAVRLMLSLDVSPSDVASMAAANPARLLGIGDDCGSIEEGKRADLTALNAAGNVTLTLIGGRLAYKAVTSDEQQVTS